MANLVAPDVMDLSESAGQEQAVRKLREYGLAKFSGVADRAVLRKIAERLLRIYPHPDSGPDGVTVVTGSGDDHRPGLAGRMTAWLDSEVMSWRNCPGTGEACQITWGSAIRGGTTRHRHGGPGRDCLGVLAANL
jgi:hypothetical protein